MLENANPECRDRGTPRACSARARRLRNAPSTNKTKKRQQRALIWLMFSAQDDPGAKYANDRNFSVTTARIRAADDVVMLSLRETCAIYGAWCSTCVCVFDLCSGMSPAKSPTQYSLPPKPLRGRTIISFKSPPAVCVCVRCDTCRAAHDDAWCGASVPTTTRYETNRDREIAQVTEKRNCRVTSTSDVVDVAGLDAGHGLASCGLAALVALLVVLILLVLLLVRQVLLVARVVHVRARVL